MNLGNGVEGAYSIYIYIYIHKTNLLIPQIK